MSDHDIPPDGSWVPEACTLPTAERPLRLAEFDQFFRDAVRGADRLSARLLRLLIKTAQRLGFTRNEVADLLAAGRHRHGGHRGAGLPARTRGKLAEVARKLAGLTVIRDTLRAAISAGCDDLVACAGSACCPLPFAELAERNHREHTC